MSDLVERLRSYAKALTPFVDYGGFTEIGMTHAQVVRRVETDKEAADELDRLRAENAELRADADRWRMLPAFLEEYQINYVRLLSAIDAARKEGK